MGSRFLVLCSIGALTFQLIADHGGHEAQSVGWEITWALFIVGACIVRAIERLRAKGE